MFQVLCPCIFSLNVQYSHTICRYPYSVWLENQAFDFPESCITSDAQAVIKFYPSMYPPPIFIALLFRKTNLGDSSELVLCSPSTNLPLQISILIFR